MEVHPGSLEVARPAFKAARGSVMQRMFRGDQSSQSSSGQLSKSLASLSLQQPRDDPFAALPDHILEVIFQQLYDSGKQTRPKVLLAITGVNKTWRRIASPVFFSDAWTSHKPITPGMLMHLCPRALPGNGMLRCFVLREQDGKANRFCFYLGTDTADPSAKLLMCAEQRGRWGYAVSTSRDVSNDAVASLSGNLLRTSYGLEPHLQSPWVRQALAAYGGGGWALARVEYHMHMKGIMLPRRMKVELQMPMGQVLDSASLAAASVTQATNLAASIKLERLSTEPMHDAGEASSSAPSGSPLPQYPAPGAGDIPIHGNVPDHTSSRSSSVKRPPSFDGSVAGDSGGSGLNPSIAPLLRLESKAPHWNDHVRCWCLDFQGRVKVASVKNLQLVCENDPTARVVMQFGKYDNSIFTLDFDPCIMSALQAFSICLTTFETKYML